jgi:hypothetical protein
MEDNTLAGLVKGEPIGGEDVTIIERRHTLYADQSSLLHNKHKLIHHSTLQPIYNY